MSLATGTRIGPYEVLAPLGSGGMGEVFRARDTRLGRDVALKTLSPTFAQDPERLERFEREARAAGSLQHPGIVTLFDVGSHEGRPYIVTELVEGGSLRAALGGGALRPARAVEVALALAEALAAAHAGGIIHRDLKPENVMIAGDGRVRLLDFGLAKLRVPEKSDAQDTSARTLDGTLLGTAAYMAPEQARGEAADHRADLFALGSVLYEMLSGRAPFHRATTAETIAALLKDDAPAPASAAIDALPGIEVLVRRCLEKRPADRFESARDFAYALEALRAGAARAETGAGASATHGAAALSQLSFKRLTFRRGTVHSARFTPDGHGVVYAAAWEGKPLELMWVFGGATESRPLGITGANLFAISRNSELAIARGFQHLGSFIYHGMLARVPLGAGTPRDVHEAIQYADWSPDGAQLAAVFDSDGAIRIEYPLGRKLYVSDGGWISEPRISRDGKYIAFLEHPIRGDDSGHVAVVDMDGRVRRLSDVPGTARGLAWSANGREIWFTGAPAGAGRALRAVTLDGAERILFQLAGHLTLHDVSAEGRALLTHGDERVGIHFNALDTGEERDLSWFDWSVLRGLTADGRMVLFDESGEGGGEEHSIFIRGTDGSPAVRLGDGIAMAISPDEKWVLALRTRNQNELVMLPVGAGAPRVLPKADYYVHIGGWFPDGRRIWVAAHRPGEPIRIYRVGLEDMSWQALSPPGIGALESRTSPDGRFMLVSGSDVTYRLIPVEGGEPRDIPGVRSHERPASWSADGRRIYMFPRGSVPAQVYEIDIQTGERKLWREIGPRDSSGVFAIAPLRLSADTHRVAYSYGRVLNDLFVVDGLE